MDRLFAIVASLVLGIWAARLLVEGFRTGRMDWIKYPDVADRVTRPLMFWTNATINAITVVGTILVIAWAVITWGRH